MHIEDDDIVAELLEYESTGLMTIPVFIALNTMNVERRKRIYQLYEVARILTRPPVDEPEL
jgi:hypothetical protein